MRVKFWQFVLKILLGIASIPMMFMAGCFLFAVALFVVLLLPWTYWAEIKQFFKNAVGLNLKSS